MSPPHGISPALRAAEFSSSAPAGPPSLDGLGAKLLYRWKIEASGSPNVTIVGGNLQHVEDQVAGVGAASRMTQGTAGSRPAHHNNGGANNKPWAETQDANRALSATIAIAAANRASLYVVGKVGANNGFVSWYLSHQGGGQTRMIPNATQFVQRGEFTSGVQVATVTSPGKDSDWHLFALRPLASGALFQIDGTTVTGNFAGNSTLTQIVAALFGFGSGVSDSGAGMHEMFIVDNATAAEDTISKNYVGYEYALTLG